MASLLDLAAELGSEEEDEDFEEGEGQNGHKPRKQDVDMDDSSEEEDDDDEEAAAEVREGFIVDEDEDEDERRQRRREKKKRRRAERDEDENLDEDDLDLIGLVRPDNDATTSTQSKFKRLKQGHRTAREDRPSRGVDDIFSEEDDELDERRPSARQQPHPFADEFDDFIEDDEFPDEERERLLEEQEVARPGRKAFTGIDGLKQSGLDENAAEDMRLAFGDGTEYDWALDMQDAMDDEAEGLDRPLELKDVFEPSQLIDRMLTDEDNAIRALDVPERLQLLRKPFKEVDLSPQEKADRSAEESAYVASMLLHRKRFPEFLVEPFKQSVAKVLHYINDENFEIPFIFQHRKDYLIHQEKEDDEFLEQSGNQAEEKAQRLLTQADMWEILDIDLKFRAMIEKRDALQATCRNLEEAAHITDDVLAELPMKTENIEEVQDIQDYLHFRYSAELKDINAMQAEANGTQKRARTGASIWEGVRASKVYNFVRAFGISADAFAQNTGKFGRRNFPEDSTERPDDLADSLLDPPNFNTGRDVLKVAKATFAEEIAMNPRLKKYIRTTFYSDGVLDCQRTAKGLKSIAEDHRYYEFKYLRQQSFGAVAQRPELFLRMLKAEEEGLVNVNLSLRNPKSVKQKLYTLIESDGFSEVAEAWNALRREVVDLAVDKLLSNISRNVKESLRAECEKLLGTACRERYAEKLDQAPYKPQGMELGTVPRVLTLSNGRGSHEDAICWAYLEDDGRVMETGKFTDLRIAMSDKTDRKGDDGKDVEAFIALVKRRNPDVIGVSGRSVETRRLISDLENAVEKFDLRGNEQPGDEERPPKLEVVTVNDEVARIYEHSIRGSKEHPNQPTLMRYCIALARYLQSPMLEYAALGKDIVSIKFEANQDLVPSDKLLKHLETAMVDMVNMVGIEINDAVSDPYKANLLPYVCGLGPRKAAQLVKVVNHNGGTVFNRAELVDGSEGRIAAINFQVWANSSSFLYIKYDGEDQDEEYLDGTRVHPEDYEIARKMAADALDLDEEDVKAETDENGPGAVIRRLVREEAQDKVNDLVLKEYADQLEIKFKQRKRATLETIRAELQNPYEELRRPFAYLSPDEVFVMFTAETRDTLSEGMNVFVRIRRVFNDHMEVKLDSGIDGGVSAAEYPDGVGGQDREGLDPRTAFQPNQTVQARVLFVNRKGLSVQLSLREEVLRRPFKKDIDRIPGEWDDAQEAADKKAAQKETEKKTGRAQRVIKHPLFRPFDAKSAEEALGSQGRGDVIIRPSSKGPDHLAVTWKVSDNIYQHIDVFELDKENEFSVGRQLRIENGKYNYSDLDELIVNHVKAMAKKVDEMTLDEKYQNLSRQKTEDWINTYLEANPKRAVYAFCINPRFPGHFYLLFKEGKQAQMCAWPVKVVPNGFEMQKTGYPDMLALKNGFKTRMQNAAKSRVR
ncbi:transcription elongation factor Spt6 [Aulographum hederae CBS 113979]|uniref:Transcription elongation factor Spt6 n=1 Tax=Aulographum hederae CBS 113979 TaxID=1176131 RepID=A0A6G1GQJ8_9PEZI|nr:transcription elongation factor Spt6 [Aulographum hederae CBS 113979]